VEALRLHVAAGPDRWVLCVEDAFEFAVAFIALVREGKDILIPGGPQGGLVAEIGAGAALLGDSYLAGAGDIRGMRSHFNEGPLGPCKVDRARIAFYTSGSLGAPKAVPKSLAQIEAELINLNNLWGESLESRTIYSTVSHQHYYGFLFSCILPLCSGRPFCSERIAYPESISILSVGPSALISSPAFLKRIHESGVGAIPLSPIPIVFSSGGVLPDEVALGAERILGAAPLEIYGSSETGGVAWRASGHGRPWTVFEGIELRIADDGRIEIRSPYLAERSFVRTDDRGEIGEDRALRLLGRADAVVKIEDKRVSLTEVESRLCESTLIAEARAVALESAGRQIIAIVAVPSPEGFDRLAAGGKRAFSNELRNHLAPHFVQMLLPRKWRFVEALPTNEMGKVRREELMSVIEREAIPYAIESMTVAEGRAELLIRFPSDCPYFDGHFREFKLLPGVAQIDVVMRVAKKHLGANLDMTSMPRVKFLRPILPEERIRLLVEFDDRTGTILFSYGKAGTGESFSSGKIRVGSAE
jgi:acyl-coenzyme A synthetase/AMP-(fatty) acid ligase